MQLDLALAPIVDRFNLLYKTCSNYNTTKSGYQSIVFEGKYKIQNVESARTKIKAHLTTMYPEITIKYIRISNHTSHAHCCCFVRKTTTIFVCFDTH